METREINSYPIVTSLSSSDYLLTDSGKRILEQNVGKRFLYANLGSGEKWIRVAKFAGSSIGFISIYNSWRNAVPTPIILAFIFGSCLYNVPQQSQVKVVLGSLSVFSKARIVYKAGSGEAYDCYLEVYQHLSTETSYYVEMQNFRNATALCELGSIPSGYVAKEFDLTVWGGGNLFVTNQLRKNTERRWVA